MSNLSLKLEQKAKILQVQRLTIQMLALHAQNLADFLQEQVTDNPLLDIRYHDVRPAGDKGDKAIDNLRSRSLRSCKPRCPILAAWWISLPAATTWRPSQTAFSPLERA